MTHPSHAILPTWTPERVARALRLFLREGFTAAEVADALGHGVSRAAVIGKIRRLGYRKSDVASPPPRAAAARKVCSSAFERRLPPQPPPLPLPPLREIEPTGRPCRLACLPRNACRWPIDDPGPGRMHMVLFCAGPAPLGPYCDAHRALAHAR
jgi:GcrA cell cycle regulator